MAKVLRHWYRDEVAGKRHLAALLLNDKTTLKLLEHKVKELRRNNEIQPKALAYFAMVELAFREKR